MKDECNEVPFEVPDEDEKLDELIEYYLKKTDEVSERTGSVIITGLTNEFDGSEDDVSDIRIEPSSSDYCICDGSCKVVKRMGS